MDRKLVSLIDPLQLLSLVKENYNENGNQLFVSLRKKNELSTFISNRESADKQINIILSHTLIVLILQMLRISSLTFVHDI